MSRVVSFCPPSTSTAQIRVVSAVRPQLLQDMLSQLMQREGDIDVVAEVDTTAKILPAIRRTGARVALIPLEGNDDLPALCEQLLIASPDLLIIGVTADSSIGYAWYRRIERVQLEEVSPDTILSAIRSEFRAAI